MEPHPSRRGGLPRWTLVVVVLVVVAAAVVTLGPSVDADEAQGAAIASVSRPSPSSPASSPAPVGVPSASPTPPKVGHVNVWSAIADGHLSPTVRGDTPYVYVPNGRPGTLEVIDPSTFRVVRRVSFG